MNQVYSMTGFSAGSQLYDSNELSCEIRSLNSRYLEIFVKVPLIFRDLEDSIKEIIRKKITRGKVNCTIAINSQTPIMQQLKVDESVTLMYTSLLEQIRAIAKIEEPIRLADILVFKDVLSFEEEAVADKGLQNALFELLEDTLEQLNQTRAVEGQSMVRDLAVRLEKIISLTDEIKDLSQQNAPEEFRKLHKRLLRMIDENSIDRNRLEMELALISDRVDISEEVVRMQSHIELFKDTLQQGSPAGKKLNFILQEMHREANTMASKSTMLEVSHRIVAVKEEIERVREQVQNIE